MQDPRQRLDELLAEKRVAKQHVKSLNTKRIDALSDLEDVRKVQSMFQYAVKVMYQNLSTRLGNVITEGLGIVFPDTGYKFAIEFVERRNNVEADIFLEDKEGNRFHPLDGVGGGVADFVSLLLRFTYIVLSDYSNILIADEPLKFIDRNRIPEAAQFIRKLCDEFDFQMIIVTHIPELVEASEKVYVIEKSGGISVGKVLS